MSYRIHRAMGWGMPWEQFKSLCKLGLNADGNYDDEDLHDSSNLSELLSNTFYQLTDADLTVDLKEQRLLDTLTYHGNEKPSRIIEPHLLSRVYTDGGRDPADIGNADDLYALAMNPDSITDIIFFPNLYYRKEWYRHSNDMDYMFEQYRTGDSDPPGFAGARDFTNYIKLNPYPFGTYLMNLQGDPIKYEYPDILKDRDDWAPAVPSEIWWYLQRIGVLDRDGICQLRPLIAQWWC